MTSTNICSLIKIKNEQHKASNRFAEWEEKKKKIFLIFFLLILLLQPIGINKYFCSLSFFEKNQSGFFSLFRLYSFIENLDINCKPLNTNCKPI